MNPDILKLREKYGVPAQGYGPVQAKTPDRLAELDAAWGNPVEQPKTALQNTISSTASDYSKAIPNFIAEAGRDDQSTSKNPIIRTAENALGATASGIGTVFAPITNAIKNVADSVANTAKDPIDQNRAIYDNPVVGKILDLFGGANKTMNDWATAHPEAARNLSNALTVGLTAAGGETKSAEKPIGSLEGIKNTTIDTTQGILDVGVKAGELAKTTKQAIKPTLSPIESVGQIIQGSTEDLPAAQRALTSLETKGVKTYKDLQSKIKQEIPKLAKEVDFEFSKDTSGGHSIKSFEQTVGEGKSAVKINYVKQGIDDLRNFYRKTGNAEGLSKIKELENKAKINGLTYKDINDLARLHGMEINAFNANGEAASGLTKQAAENTRKGLKFTARNGLGTSEAQALDAKLTDLYDTQSLIDKMVEKINTSSQKTTKQGVVPKTIEKVVQTVDTITGSPLKALGKAMGTTGGTTTISPIELENLLQKNLKNLKK